MNNYMTTKHKCVDQNLIINCNELLMKCPEKSGSNGPLTPIRRVEQVLAPASTRQELITKIHKHLVHGHRRWIATYFTLSDHYFWPDMQIYVYLCQNTEHHHSHSQMNVSKLCHELHRTIWEKYTGNNPKIRFEHSYAIVDQLSGFDSTRIL